VSEFERNAAKDESDQHEQDRKINSRNHDCKGERKGCQEPYAPKHKPRLVEVPDWRDRIHHQIAARGIRRKRKQDAHSEIEAIEQDVHKHTEGQDRRPQWNKVERHALFLTRARRAGQWPRRRT
jgi:hypothetical protein